MPVEIRELVIKATITAKTEANVGAEAASDFSDSSGTGLPSSVVIDQDEVIQECVRQVLKILQKQKER